MIRAIRPNAMAQDDAVMLGGWNVAPNIAYTLRLLPGPSSCGVLLYDESGATLIATGAALSGTEQPCVLIPQTGQTVGMVDADLGWHLLLTTTGTESQRTIRLGPAVDLPDEIHPVYGDDDLALARATAAIDAAAHYIDDVTVSCPLGVGAGLGDVVSVPVDGAAVVGQVESITWTATPDGVIEQAVIRRHVAIAPDAFVEIIPPTVADDAGTATQSVGTSGNVLENDDTGLVVVAVNGLSANVGVPVDGDNGGTFTIAADGSWSFDPDGDFAMLEGSETADTSVTYHASSGTAEAMATLTITVSRVNATPVAVDDTSSTDAVTTISGNVLTNDTDADLDTLTVSQVAGSSGNVGVAVAGSNGGLFTIGPDGSWVFDPSGDFNSLTGEQTATTSVTYHASDGLAEDEGTLTVTVTAMRWWTPEELGGAVYFDPDFLDRMTLDGTSIAALRSVYNAAIELTQGTSTARPQLLSGTLNGANEISFDGGDFLQTDTSLGFGSSPVTFFLVEREMSGGIGAAPLSFNSGPNGGIVFQKNTTGLQPFSPNIPFESTQERILMYVRPQQGVAYCAKDGVITGTDDALTGTYGSSFALGKRLSGGYLLGGGKITAVLMIPRLLKNTEIAKVVGYLAHAKGITGNLQASHPYKTEKPVVEIYSGPTDPYWSNVVLCLNADGYNGDRGVDDAKGKQVFPFGNTQIITSPGYNAIRLDGSGDYAKVNAHIDFDFGSGDWCVEGWIYRYANGGGFFVQREGGVSQGIFLVFNSSGNLDILLGNGSWFFSKVATITAGLNTLFHVAVVRNGSTIKVYQNGVEILSQPVSGTLSSGLGAFVGADPGNSYFAMNCHIKGLRVTKGVPRYTAAFTPDDAPFLT